MPAKRNSLKTTRPCNAWESCQVPEEKTSVCFHCGWRKRDHKVTRKYHEILFQELHFQLSRELTIDPATLKIGELHGANRQLIKHLSSCPNGPAMVLEAKRASLRAIPWTMENSPAPWYGTY